MKKSEIKQNPGHPAVLEKPRTPAKHTFTTSRITEFLLAHLKGQFDEINYLSNRNGSNQEIQENFGS